MSTPRIIASRFGKNIRVTIFGGSREPAIGVTIEGLPRSFHPEDIDEAAMHRFLGRLDGDSAAPHGTRVADLPTLRSRQPLTYMIPNYEQRPEAYAEYRFRPRPGHADYTALVKYGGDMDMSEGGPFSGRMMLPLCVAGAVAKQILRRGDVFIQAALVEAGGIRSTLVPENEFTRERLALSGKPELIATDPMYRHIREVQAQGDSVGGLVMAMADGLPAGIGGPLFNGLESYISPIAFGIPGVKGVAFGEGFGAVAMQGTEHNDPFIYEGDLSAERGPGHTVPLEQIYTLTNHAGGILGGISSGMPLIMKVAVKPTPSVPRHQQTVDLRTGASVSLTGGQDADPCIALRAVPAVESALALGILDAILE